MATSPKKREVEEGEHVGEGKNSAAEEPAGAAAAGKVHTCSVCFREFDRLKALHGHMRVHERGCRAGRDGREPEERAVVGWSKEGSPPPPPPPPSRPLPPTAGWLVTGQRGRKGRSASPASGQGKAGVGSDGTVVPAVKKPRAETPPPPAVKEANGEGGSDVAETSLAFKMPSEEAAPLLAVETAVEVGSDETETAAVEKRREEPVPLAVKKRRRAEAVQPPAVEENAGEVGSTETNARALKKRRAEATPPPPVVEETAGREDPSWSDVVIQCAHDLVFFKFQAYLYAAQGEAAVSEPVSSSLAIVAVEGTEANVAEIKLEGNGNCNGKGAPKTFTCTHCGRDFSTHQGLGGHMASHRKSKDAALAAAAGEAEPSQAQSKAAAKAAGKHICELCGKEYPTGQALGGHKRKHYNGSPNGKERSAPAGDEGSGGTRTGGDRDGDGDGSDTAATAQNQLVVYVGPLDGKERSTQTDCGGDTAVTGQKEQKERSAQSCNGGGGGGSDTTSPAQKQLELYIGPPCTAESSSSAPAAAAAEAPSRLAGDEVRSLRLFGFDIAVSHSNR